MALTTAQVLDKLHNYLEARFFPWNVLLEPVDPGSLDHYLGFLSTTDLLSPPSPESLQGALRHVADDFLVDPESPEARSRHGSHAPAYPFAFGQALAFASLAREGRRLADLADLPSIAGVLGASVEECKAREEFVARRTPSVRRRLRAGGELRGAPLLDGGGARLGPIVDFLMEGEEVVEVLVRPEREFSLAGLRKIGESVAFPAEEVRLRNPFSGIPRYQKRL